jgi:hypothetical protein
VDAARIDREGEAMTSTNVRQMKRSRLDSAPDVDDELRHIRDLVVVRNALARRGATHEELAECDTVIDVVRTQLAATVRRDASRYAA